MRGSGPRDAGGRGAKERLADINRNEAAERAFAQSELEQDVRLLRGSCTQLDERLRSTCLNDLMPVEADDGVLGSSRVVLREQRDLLEQLRPALVVEPLG